MNTSLKTCFKCGAEKSLDHFYKHKQMKDGHLNKCKECTKLDAAMRALSTVGSAKIKAYERERVKTAHRKACLIEYQRAHRLKYPEKYKARGAVGNAIRDGKLHRKPCEACGNPKSQSASLGLLPTVSSEMALLRAPSKIRPQTERLTRRP